MKIAIAAAFVLSLVSPALAQDNQAIPLLRVFIDAPYFYDILANVGDSSDPQAHNLTLLVEGKEVGESRLVYNCDTGDYAEMVVTDWSGNSARFIQPALMAYHDLYC